MSYIVAVTGASGAVYAQKTLAALNHLGQDVSLTITEPGVRVCREELNWQLPELDDAKFFSIFKEYLNWDSQKSTIEYYDYRDIGAAIASGSNKTQGMIIIPCTAGTLSGVAVGASANLVERAADIMLKENRPLIVVLRETPLNRIHLKNMLELSDAGAKIVPASPAFYHNPQSIDDMVNFIVGKVFDLLHIEHALFKRWEGSN